MNEPVQIDDRVFMKAVRDLVKENPDYVYQVPASSTEGCMYTETDPDTGELRGSCLIGQAAIRAGIPIVVVADWVNWDVRPAAAVLEPHGITEDIRHWAYSAQAAQDCETTWRESLKTADRLYHDIDEKENA